MDWFGKDDMDTLNIGIIGAGGISLYSHMPSLNKNPRAKVVAVADINLDSAQRLAKQFDIPYITDNYKDLLDDSNISTIDICVPHHLHYPITMDSLNAGKHVILEKPIAMNLVEADEMIATADRLNKRFFVSLNQRFLPAHNKVKQMLEEGLMGNPFLANIWILGNVIAEFNDPNNWRGKWDRAGGGALFDSGTHAVDLMRYWFGEPMAVTAVLRNLLSTIEGNADDNASALFEFNSGLMVNVGVSLTVTHEPWSEKKFIYGTGGDVSIISESSVPMFYVKDDSPQIIDVEHEANWQALSVDRALSHFIDCILTGKAPMVSARDARETLRTILAAYQSSAEEKRVPLL